MLPKPSQKIVVVGMSGGVDSSLTAALLQEQGYFVIGVYMKNWSEPIKGVEHCPWVQDQLDARMVAQQLDIPFYTVNFEEEYKQYVIDSFFADYAAGRTPNPDVLCNQFIKFDAFLQYSQSLGADFIATGHYARVKNGQLFTGLDKHKDQSYFLWAIEPSVLERVLFPLGELTKDEVRQEAVKRRLVTAKKKDSQGICFIGQADVRQFLAAHLASRAGNVLDPSGRVIGQHDGAWFYTIGQRAGLSDVVWGDTTHRPILYVLKTDTVANTITIGEDVALYASQLVATSARWFGDSPQAGQQFQAKIRYGQKSTPCVMLKKSGTGFILAFTQPQRAITPGQSVVLYDQERLVGGGIIEEAVT